MIARVLVRFVSAVGLGVFALLASAGDAQAVCGDGVIDGIEECDLALANGQPGFCCSASCTFSSAATGCRPDAGACDVTEFCTGASATCPADAFEVAGTACGSASVTVCDNADSCDGAGACASNFELTTTECRADAGACDIAETCDGAGSCPSDGFELAGTACGSSNNTICDNADSCDGAGACADNFELATFECRADAGVCDVAELCDGAGSCPVDDFEPTEHECRAATGDCDLAETCDGLGSCPVDGFELVGTACGNTSDTVCDDPDSCDGSGDCAPHFALATVECRADAGACDVAELCDGAGSCPVDGFEVVGTACGSAIDTVCDDPDSCDESGLCAPHFALATVECRADAGECDVAELCDGAGACPVDGFEVTGTACGSATDTACDNPDTCNASGTCESHLELATFECRPTAGDCDIAELCDGAGGGCPVDETVAEGVSCRTSAGPCDLEEFCPGADPECPIDVFRPDIYSCRPPVGGCDLAELCSGSTPECPMDVIADAGVTCRESEAECDQAEICDGVDGLCPENFSIAIDFDDSPAPAFFSQATSLTNQYAALGVVWQGTGARVSEFALAGLTDYSAPNFVAYSENQSMGSGGASDNIDTMDLACTAQAVSFLVGAESQGSFGASAFDGNGSPIDQTVIAMDTAMQIVTLVAEPDAHIARVDYVGAGVTELDGKPRFAIDDLVLLIPEPAQALIGLTSFAMLAVLRKRARLR